MKRVCPRCGGSGQVEDDVAVGQRMRGIREGAGVSQREMARRLGYSASYVRDLELGRRHWSGSLEATYETLVFAPESRRAP